MVKKDIGSDRRQAHELLFGVYTKGSEERGLGWGRGEGTMAGLTGRVGGLADINRFAPPAVEVLPLGPATEPGLPAYKEHSPYHYCA